MPEFTCPVVRLEGFTKHPNADTLSIVTVEGCPVIVRTDDWKEGDYGVYIPIEAVVPATVPGTEFLGDHRRIKAKKLRGIFSMGLLLPTSILANGAPWKPGEDVAERLGIKKYEEPERHVGGASKLKAGKQIVDPKLGPVYDLENYRKYGRTVFNEGEYVYVTEKIHGTNFRFGHKTVRKGFMAWLRGVLGKPAKTEFFVGSHRTWRLKDDNSAYWQIAKEYNLAERTKQWPDVCFYGEIYGEGVQDLTYGTKELKMALFDIWDGNTKSWVDYSNVQCYCSIMGGLPMVPIIWAGRFNAAEVEPLRNGPSTYDPKQIREGVVIRKQLETKNPAMHVGRSVLKLVGEDYLLRKNATEFH